MNINNKELAALRAVLSKDDKKAIAGKVGMSERTVEAVIQGRRTNDKIEQEVLKLTKDNIEKLLWLVDKIILKNEFRKIDITEYEKQKQSTEWAFGVGYSRYMDALLQLAHIKFECVSDVYEYLKLHYKHVLYTPYYCVDIIIRSLGCNAQDAITCYNNNI